MGVQERLDRDGFSAEDSKDAEKNLGFPARVSSGNRHQDFDVASAGWQYFSMTSPKCSMLKGFIT